MTVTIPAELQLALHDLYRHLHAHPELSFQEHQTAELVEQRMHDLGFTTTRVAGTGVAAWLTNGDGPVVAFRADLDALPVRERTGLDYASTAVVTSPDGTEVPVMHACGHDVHITCAIGIASLLTADLGAWRGTIVFVFQPAEELAAGAMAMVEDGLWDRVPLPEVVLGQHVGPARAGTLQVSIGPAMAVADAWRVTIHGRGGHGSRPEQTVDPVLIAAHIIVRLQSVVTREVAAQSASVITVATIKAGTKENVIPDTAEFTVNIRHLDQAVRARVLDAVRRVIRAEAEASGAKEPTIEELYTFPLTYNDPDVIEDVISTMVRAVDMEHVVISPAQMGSEDFGHLGSSIGVPTAYWFFGGMGDDVVDGPGPVPSNHSPHFAPVLEPTLTTGVRVGYAALLGRLAR